MFKTKAVFERKPVELYQRDCIVEKIIRMTDPEFEQYNMDLMREQTFLQENASLMSCKNGVYHCLLVLGENNPDGILIEAEGYNFARYAAFLPNARMLVEMELQIIADSIIQEGTENTLQGCWNAGFDDLEERFGYKLTEDRGFEKMLLEILENRPEVSEATMNDDRVALNFNLDYCLNLNENEKVTSGISDDVIRLTDLIRVPIQDLQLVHHKVDMEPASIAYLDANTLTDPGKQEWADVLNAQVVRILHGNEGIRIECAGVDPQRLAKFSMSEHVRGTILAERTIYSFTENGQSRNYSTPNRGSVLSAVKLLHALENIKRNIPDGNATSMLEVLKKEYNFVEFQGKTLNLLHAMDEEAFSEALRKIEYGEREDAYIKIDFDANRIQFLNVSRGRSSQIALPITSLVDVFDGSLRNKNSSKCYVNKEQFESQLEKLCEMHTEFSSLEEAVDEICQEPQIGL